MFKTVEILLYKLHIERLKIPKHPLDVDPNQCS